MGNLGKLRFGFKQHCPYVPYTRTYLKNVLKDLQERVTLKQLINDIAPYFSFPKSEVTRLTNCIFHEILTKVREGKNVEIPYFGTFQPYVYTGKVTFNIGLNQYNSTPKIIQRCQPMLLPSKYSLHVCSPRTAFNTPAWYIYRVPGKKLPQNYPEIYLWYKNQERYRRRFMMLYDNPYKITGFSEADYVLKESTATKFPTDTDKKELAHLESLIRDQAYLRDKTVVKRFVLKDYYKKYKCLFTYHNFLTGKYYVGCDNNFFMTEEEVNKNLTRHDVMATRLKKNKKAFTSTSHLPKSRPSDLPYSFEEELESLQKD